LNFGRPTVDVGCEIRLGFALAAFNFIAVGLVFRPILLL